MASQFRELLPATFLDRVQTESGVKINKRVYTPLVVLWLLVVQRLQGGASMEDAVLELLQGLPDSFWPQPCKRIREWREQGKTPSSHTGAYNVARQTLPLSIVEETCDYIFQQLLAQLGQPAAHGDPPAFLLDGSTIRLAHTPDLCHSYPPGKNQYGASHWPILRILVAHDLHTGLAMRPQWGAMHGDQAVSEQSLLDRAMDRLPAAATVIGDSNFGVFSVAYTATQRQHPVVLRLTTDRALRLAGGALHDGMDRVVNWQPSRWERRSHPELPEDACVAGRLLVQQVQPDNGAAPFLLALFTTLSGSATECFRLYGKRWLIETDLRSLKCTLHLDQLTCSTPDMVAKEINMGVVAYNLVRALIGFASRQSGIPPRGYRFAKVRRILETFAPALANAPNEQIAGQILDQIMTYIQQSKLPRRKRKRPSYPRQVWNRGDHFPKRRH